MGIWDGILDLNGIDKLQAGEPGDPGLTAEVNRIALGNIPVCGMNTAFAAELTPAYYFLPDLWVDGWQLSRHDDIWGGYLVKRLMDRRGDLFAFGHPVVEHTKQTRLERVVVLEQWMHLMSMGFYDLVDAGRRPGRGGRLHRHVRGVRRGVPGRSRAQHAARPLRADLPRARRVDAALVEGVHVMSATNGHAADPVPERGVPSLGDAIRGDLAHMAKVKETPFPSIGGYLDVLSIPGTWAVIIFRLASTAHHKGLRPGVAPAVLRQHGAVRGGAALGRHRATGPGHPPPGGHGLRQRRAHRRALPDAARTRRWDRPATRSGPGQPTLGDDVTLLDSAKVLGPVHIGDRSMIGTNAVVIDDVPPDTFVYGVRKSDTMRPLAEMGLGERAEAELGYGRGRTRWSGQTPPPDPSTDDPQRSPPGRGHLSMRALIDATALGSERGGDETMLRGVIRGLALCSSDEDRITVLADTGVDPLTGTATSQPFRVDRMPHRSGARHFGVDLPSYLSRRRHDFDIAFTVTHAPLRSAVPVALMVQDLSFLHLPDVYPRATRQRLRRLVSYQTKRASAVLTVSEFCRRDLIDSYGLDPLKVHVVPNSVEPLRPLSSDRRDRAAGRTAGPGGRLAVPALSGEPAPPQERGRRPAGLRVRPTPRSGAVRPPVRGGRAPAGGAPASRRRPRSRWPVGSSSSVASTTTCASSCSSRPTRWSTCRGSRASDCLRSRPWPAATPVLAADAAAIPEVTGGAALLVDPDDLEAITDGIRRIVTDSALRDELVARGLDRVAHYDLVSTGMAARAALGDAALASVPR